MQLLAVSLGLFYVIHMFARPPPRTMTREWQEATNEYAKVRIFPFFLLPRLLSVNVALTDHHQNRGRRSNRSPVSAARDTPARASSRAALPRSRRKLETKSAEWNEGRQDQAWWVNGAAGRSPPWSALCGRFCLPLCPRCPHIRLSEEEKARYMYSVLCHSQSISLSRDVHFHHVGCYG